MAEGYQWNSPKINQQNQEKLFSYSDTPVTTGAQDAANVAQYGGGIDRSTTQGLGTPFSSPVTPSGFTLPDWKPGNQGIPQDTYAAQMSANISGNRPTDTSWMSGDYNNVAAAANSYEGPSRTDIAKDGYITVQEKVGDALVKNLGQSTAMGWAGFAVQAVQSVANIALSIEQYKLGKKQFKQAKKEYAYNVDKREQSIYDTVATRAEQSGMTGQEKADWMASRGVDVNRYN